MHPAKGCIRTLIVLGLSLRLVGCNEGPAREALAEAETEVADERADLERLAPEALARLESELRAAREALAEGRYTDALRAAQQLPDHVREARDRATTRRGVLASAWEELSHTVPDRLGRLRACLRGAAAAQAPSAEAPWVRSARARLLRLEACWDGASRAFEGGQLSRAVTEARAVDSRIDELSESLGCAPGC